MQQNDVLLRAILYPKAWANGVFDVEAMIKLDAMKDSPSRYGMSVASEYLLREPGASTAYGCGAATAANQRFTEKSGRNPEPLHEAVHYLGFYDMHCGKCREVKLEHYDVTVNWRPAEGDAHFQIELDPRGGGGTEKQRKEDRRIARTLLSLCLFGLRRDTCDCDIDVRDDLNAIDIPTLPMSEQVG